ncbi:diphosphomevalonate decarboxylase [Aureisphaera galaxeae]|uniref:diphosphomevalonate/mevalonate 3,5-bisphosphate decarboxylase family protein n=1 Tax=Aureisphaera galaxeae TaxID=1538023 RepID=UPI00235080F5|nr:diphosphomevalonate decarboxylase [Aureisphaera galaxeae]MDC8002942.1 diphosphomevalonate decarboxylase [Aureisphaera galaxeae]
MTEQDFIPSSYPHPLMKGSVSFQSPSNIALVKYWGKYGEQLPKNASISFTLNECHTLTTLHYMKKDSPGFNFEVYLDGNREEGFEPKIQKFLERIQTYVPFVEDYTFRIETSNSFPHSSGIASSASGMSALAMCLMDMERQMLGGMEEDHFLKKASFLSRLGSGSASRSIEGPLVVWGTHENIEGSSHLFGVTYPYEVHPNFTDFQDAILLVDKGEKQVSSTVGHNLMHDHPFAEQRFQQANNQLAALIPVLKEGDLDAFIDIVESEALSLHAMMMTSTPNYILMKPNTLQIIERIRNFRKDTQTKVCFTLDAGANVHVLFPNSEKDRVTEFIKNELAPFCKNGEYILDHTGQGAVQKNVNQQVR